MIDARFRPLLKWTREPGLKWRQSHFKTAYNKTLDALEYELGHLQARNIVIEAGYRPDQIRNDGWPRGGVSPSHPGCVLYFDGRDGALCFPCGTYGRLEHNLHAIALTLENLRAIDRYGATLGHEQYRGFAALVKAVKQCGMLHRHSIALLDEYNKLDPDPPPREPHSLTPAEKAARWEAGWEKRKAREIARGAGDAR